MTIEQDFHEKVSKQVRLVAEGLDRYRVFTPFSFDDGDNLAIVLRKEEGQWVFSDEAHTYMHLTFDGNERDLQTGTQRTIISNALSSFQIEDRDGELLLHVPNERFGDALYSLVQAILKISNVSFLSRERVRSTFFEDFKTILIENIAEERMTFRWHHPDRDPKGKYTVDCRINAMDRPLIVSALNSDSKTRDATIALLQFEKWEIPVRSLAIFENQESINRNVLARFSDICDKQFSSLTANRDRIQRFLLESIL